MMENKTLSLIIKICIIVLFAVLVALFLILRYAYKDNDNITSTEFYVYGLTDGMGIECGETYDRVYVSFPNFVDVSDIYTVSTDPEVAYLSIDKENVLGNRVLACEVVTLKPGIVELYVRTSNGDLVSESYSVNVYESENGATLTETTVVYTEPQNGNVYITPKGSKYHLKQSCAGNTSYQVTLGVAVNEGRLPCKICATK